MVNDPNKRIMQACERSGLPKLVFAERLGFNPATLSNWFRPDSVKVLNRAPEYAALWAEANFPPSKVCPVCHNPLNRSK